MPAPFIQTMTIAVGADYRSGSASVHNVDVRAIRFVSGSNLTAGSFYLEGATITDASGSRGNSPATTAFSEIFDSTGARVLFTRQNGKLITLSEASRDLFKSCHYVRLVATAPQATADALIDLIGETMYK